ncbi:MAG: efflux RND transporter permease subunit [Planctomycetes bacterium]|nr:efflux RND transporter permease subunit [Planctomycetota bacterium]
MLPRVAASATRCAAKARAPDGTSTHPLKGSNTKQVIDLVKEKVKTIRLPNGVRIVPYYDQADLVERALGTVSEALKEAALLIVVVLFLFLWNFRSAFIVLCSIPISVLIACSMMGRYGISANLQSLGGLAIGIGMMVDGSVVMVENIFRRLAEDRPAPADRLHHVLTAAREVARPVSTAVLIIIVVFLPLFTLQGIEGKLFAPMAFTISFAMFGSLLVSLFLVPALSTWLLSGRLSEKDSFLVRGLKWGYGPVVRAPARIPSRWGSSPWVSWPPPSRPFRSSAPNSYPSLRRARSTSGSR